jgi:hypothetical protein
MPRPPWTWEYEDDLLPHITARRVHPSCVCFLDLEVRSTTFFPNACAIHSTEEAHIYFSLPGAIGMYALSLGVQRINEILPLPVYALLSGLNASTVGIIALAAVQLAEKAIRDKLTRILVLFGACAGLCYNALWYFPLLMLIGGLASVIWDGWMSQMIGKVSVMLKRKNRSQESTTEEAGAVDSVQLEDRVESHNGMHRRTAPTSSLKSSNSISAVQQPSVDNSPLQTEQAATGCSSDHMIRIKVGIASVVLFFGIHVPSVP